MRRTGRRFLALALACALALTWAAAEGGQWACPNCGQGGNTGNYCSNCGAARPDEHWTCGSCGQEGNTGNFCSNCGSARPSGSAGQQAVVNDQLEQIPGETSRVKVVPLQVDASSYIINKQNPGRWLPANAADGDESTCWQFSAKSGLKGKSWLTLSFASGQVVDEIWFKNGFWAYNDKGKEQYSINARLKGIRVEFLYGGESGYRDAAELTLRDESFQDWQRCTLGRHENVLALRISVLTVYPGSYYKNDVCLSEVMAVQYAAAETVRTPAPDTAATVYESRPEVTGVGLLMKLATRSGPGTEYDEPGTFFGSSWKSTTVRVLGRSWDGSVWWVLVDFSNGGKANYRVWTGLKRVDVDISKLRDINPIGQGTVNATSETYRGPGPRYAKAKVTIKTWKDVLAYGRENGYVEVEFQQGSKMYRLWVPESVTSIDWGTDFSGET